MKIINRNELISSFIFLKFYVLFSICHFNRLFHNVILFEIMMIIYAAYEKSNDVIN